MHKIGLRQVVVLILTACLGIRWIPVAGAIGPVAIWFWLIGAITFLLPLSLIVIELSANFSGDGGIYLWAQRAFGAQVSYLVAWLYWVNNFFFYPALVVFMVANFAYLVGHPELATKQLFVVVCVIIALWLAIIINTRGIQLMSNITGFACILNLGLGIFIISAAIYTLATTQASATSFAWHNFFPSAQIDENLSNLTLLMFALSGVELIPTLAGSIQNSRKTIARGVLIAITLVMTIYIFGTLAINVVLSPAKLNNTTGLMDALIVISTQLGLPWLAQVLIFALLMVELAALIVWLVAPTVMFFECVGPQVLPAWLTRLNAQAIPANALYLIGIAVTLIVILSQYLPTVNSIFTTLVLMGAIVYFIPFLILAVSYLRLKVRGQLSHSQISTPVARVLAGLLTATVFLGIGCSFAPPPDIKTIGQTLVYEAELIGGPLVFGVVGLAIYRLHQRKSNGKA
jgi:amino acid transporter